MALSHSVASLLSHSAQGVFFFISHLHPLTWSPFVVWWKEEEKNHTHIVYLYQLILIIIVLLGIPNNTCGALLVFIGVSFIRIGWLLLFVSCLIAFCFPDQHSIENQICFCCVLSHTHSVNVFCIVCRGVCRCCSIVVFIAGLWHTILVLCLHFNSSKSFFVLWRSGWWGWFVFIPGHCIYCHPDILLLWVRVLYMCSEWFTSFNTHGRARTHSLTHLWQELWHTHF